MKKNVSIAVTLVAITACVAALLLLARKDDSRTNSQPAVGEWNPPQETSPATLGALPKKADDANAAHPRGPADDLLAAVTDDGRSKEPTARVALVGRVVDDRRRPVARAIVRVLGAQFSESTGTTDTKGRFRVETTIRAKGKAIVHVVDGTTRTAIREVSGTSVESPGEIDAGTIELEDATAIDVRVTSSGAAASAAVIVWADATAPGDIGRGAPMHVGMTASDGRVRVKHVPLGFVSVYAQSREGLAGRSTVLVKTVEGPHAIDVALRPRGSLAVRVIADDDSSPVVNATVSCERTVEPDDADLHVSLFWNVDVQPPKVATTGADGRARIDGRTAGEMAWLKARAPGFSEEIKSAEREETSVEIRLRRDTTPASTVFPIVEGELPAPKSGTTVRVLRSADGELNEGETPPTGVIDEGRVVARPGGRFDGIAIAPDGSIAPLLTDEGDWIHGASPTGRPTSFAKPRRLTVHVVGTDGHPVSDLKVGLDKSQGTWASWLSARPTDAEGRVVFENLPPWKYRVQLAAGPHEFGEVELAQPDLTAGDVVSEVVLSVETTVLVRITVDGKPALPSRLQWWLRGAHVLSADEDPEAGTLRIRARILPSGDTKPRIDVEGGDRIEARVPFEWPASGDTVTVNVALASKPNVTGRVLSRPDGLLDIQYQRWEEGKGWDLWAEMFWAPGDPEPGRPTSEPRPLSPRRAGRFRIFDRYSGLVSEPFDTTAGAAPTEITLDLTSLQRIRGRVDVPDGYDVTEAEVKVDGPGIDSSVASKPMHDYLPAKDWVRDPYRDGTFVVPAPSGIRVKVWVKHPALVPAKEGGSVEVAAPTDGVVLRLVEGPTVRVRAVDEKGAAMTGNALARAALYVRPLAAGAEDFRRRDVRIGDDGVIRASGLATGDYDIWLDVPPFASRRFDGVHVEDSTKDLGDVRLDIGTVLTVTLVTGKGIVITDVKGDVTLVDVPQPKVRERHVAENSIRRKLESAEGGRRRFVGLCAGRWHVHLTWKGADNADHEAERDVTVDGRADASIEVEAK